MAANLPAVRYLPSYPEIVRSVSRSRTGKRTIAAIDFADPFWRVEMTTVSLSASERLLMEAFRDLVASGMETVIYTPKHQCIPKAYWGNANAAALANTGLITGFAGRKAFTFNSVDNGLTLGPGDLIGLEQGDYKTMVRVQTGGVAVGNALSVTVEPIVPGFITTGATVVFKQPRLNCRVEGFTLSDEIRPTASFSLVEVPK